MVRDALQARHDLGTFTTVALGGSAAFFVLHASVDWLLRISAVAIPGFLLLGGCAAASGTRGVELVPGRQRAALDFDALETGARLARIWFRCVAEVLEPMTARNWLSSKALVALQGWFKS